MTENVVAAFAARGADSIEHPGGTLLAHLTRVAELLETWGAREHLVVAGLTHAAYGTDGFDVVLFGLDERQMVAALIGDAAEDVVYRYASCDREHTLGQIGRREPVDFRDRFTGVSEPIGGAELRAFAELTVANELDLVGHSADFRRAHGAAITALFAKWKGVVSEPAFEELERATDLLRTTTRQGGE